jgi:hypothetical protein
MLLTWMILINPMQRLFPENNHAAIAHQDMEVRVITAINITIETDHY